MTILFAVQPCIGPVNYILVGRVQLEVAIRHFVHVTHPIVHGLRTRRRPRGARRSGPSPLRRPPVSRGGTHKHFQKSQNFKSIQFCPNLVFRFTYLAYT